MKDVTVIESSTNFVRFIINNPRAYTLTCIYPELVQTTKEVQTVYAIGFRVFENACWKYGITVADYR